MSVTASNVIEGALRFLGLLDANDPVQADDLSLGLTRLNKFLNGLNSRGCVFENVALAAGDTVPIPAQEEDDCEKAFALNAQGFWGRQLTGSKLTAAIAAENRFIAAHKILATSRADAGLLRMPSQRRYRF